MFPVETWDQKKEREDIFLAGAREFLSDKADGPKTKEISFVCLQEVNPARRKTRFLKKALNLEGESAEANVGMRVGSLSYPFLLEEGLAILWEPAFTPMGDSPTQRLVLSGNFAEFKAPFFDIPISLQLSERRVALLATGMWEGYKIAMVNLHLHHGNPKWKMSGDRRLAELKSLVKQTESIFKKQDFVILTGDFNCYSGLPEFQFVMDQGFEEVSLDAKKKPIVTWDPFVNQLCKNSVQLTKDPVMREWDEHRNPFDHVFVKRVSKKAQDIQFKTKSERVFDKPSKDGTWASDHYGIISTLSWKEG